MGYASPPSLQHIHGPGIRERACSLLVDPWERVQCPTWSGSANMTTAKRNWKSQTYCFVEANHYHHGIRDPEKYGT